VIRFGTAGWSYRDWSGVVYPEKKPKGWDPLTYLASFFDTIEVNSTFYHPARAEVAKRWTERVAENPRFRFTAKLWRRFTHERGSAWSADEVREARAGLEPLAEAGRLGAVLLQFPWSFRRDEPNREWLDDLSREFSDFPLVLEVRHSSWNTPDLFAALAERGIGFVNIDQPLFDNSIEPSARATARIGYVRVHGRNYRDWFREKAGRDARYDYLYTAEELAPWAERIEQVAADPATEESYVITNNHFRGKAPANAIMLQAMVEAREVPAPPALFEEYEDALAPYAHVREP
jgi:uncharacterized protein YecE (DUF72 family)